ncbi:MAG: hypothetical protein H6807_06090 [Planctomycetes bacterium]|nr:hypothetical protein [Planctomycetota bacterium]
MKTISCIVLSLILLPALAWRAEAQSSTKIKQPFERLKNARGGNQDGQGQPVPPMLSVPQVMPVVRSHRDPVKVVFETTAATEAGDPVLDRIDRRRIELARALRAARANGDMAEASRLLREMEGLRQERLERRRLLAPPRVVVPVEKEAGKPRPIDAGGGGGETPKPILPIPTRPGTN